MRGSFVTNPGASPPRAIKVNKRSQGINPSQMLKSSMHNLADALQNQKAISQQYKDRNDRNNIKCHFLYNKLTALGNIEGVPEMINNEVSEVDIKIYQLEVQIRFKRSQQLIKLRKRVASFLEQINFSVLPQDMDKIEDEVEIVLFLLDVFQQKFNEMTAERKQVDQIIVRLEESSTVQDHDQRDNFKKQNLELLQKVSSLQQQINQLSNEQIKKIQEEVISHTSEFPKASQERSVLRQQELKKAERRIQELERQIKVTEERYQVIQKSLNRSKKQEARWRERYHLMEQQKDERIRLIEGSIPQKKKQVRYLISKNDSN